MDKYNFSKEIGDYLAKSKEVAVKVADLQKPVIDLYADLSKRIKDSFVEREFTALNTKLGDMGVAISEMHVEHYKTAGIGIRLDYVLLEIEGENASAHRLLGHDDFGSHLNNKVFREVFERTEKEGGYWVRFGDELLYLYLCEAVEDIVVQEGEGEVLVSTPSDNSPES